MTQEDNISGSDKLAPSSGPVRIGQIFERMRLADALSQAVHSNGYLVDFDDPALDTDWTEPEWADGLSEEERLRELKDRVSEQLGYRALAFFIRSGCVRRNDPAIEGMWIGREFEFSPLEVATFLGAPRPIPLALALVRHGYPLLARRPFQAPSDSPGYPATFHAWVDDWDKRVQAETFSIARERLRTLDPFSELSLIPVIWRQFAYLIFLRRGFAGSNPATCAFARANWFETCLYPDPALRYGVSHARIALQIVALSDLTEETRRLGSGLKIETYADGFYRNVISRETSTEDFRGAGLQLMARRLAQSIRQHPEPPLLVYRRNATI